MQEADKAKGKGRVYNLAEIAYKEQLLLQAPNEGMAHYFNDAHLHYTKIPVIV